MEALTIADVQHSALTDPQLHEPKGASTATANTVYVADGAGSGSWVQVPSAALNESEVDALVQTSIADNSIDITGRVFFTAVIDDVSTAGQVYIAFPKAATIVAATSVLGGAITTGDATITFKNAAGASMGTITVANASSAEGDIDSATFSSNNTVTDNGRIEIETDGGSTNAVPLFVTIEATLVTNV